MDLHKMPNIWDLESDWARVLMNSEENLVDHSGIIKKKKKKAFNVTVALISSHLVEVSP